MNNRHLKPDRAGSIYIAVLGTALIVALLGMSALIGQRLQNRMITASSDARQAQLNANTAIELGLLAMKNDTSWRTNNTGGNWFVNRGTNAGTCTLNVTDPIDGNLSNNLDDPVVITGTGYSGQAQQIAGYIGQAQQIAKVTVDPRRQPADCLKLGNTAQPNWTNIFVYYGGPPSGVGTQIETGAGKLQAGAHPVANFAQNPDMESDTVNGDPPYWVGNASGTGSAQVQRTNNEHHSINYSLRVRSRSKDSGDQNAIDSSGPSQSVSSFLKPETAYVVQTWVQADDYTNTSLTWRFTLRIKPSNSSVLTVSQIATEGSQSGGWLKLSQTLTTPSWTGDLDYAWVTVSSDDVWNNGLLGIGAHWDHPDFYMDDFLIKEATTGLFIYKQELGPAHNSLYTNAPTNPNGLYWIDCKVNGVNQDLYIERSRILGTLLILNPGANSRICYGPINWSPAIPGYPALLVNGDFAIRATNHPLSETENGVDYNFDGITGNYNNVASEIHGLVGVSGVLTYKQNPQIRGRVIVGGNGGVPVNNGSPTVTYVPDSLINPPPPLGGFYTYRYQRRPASAEKVVLH